ncbi:AsnC family protein (plasmid) [Actinacidiphila glaucinigra]|uniref:AsnC family protein n=1 Tax=Actinacidiphila glaucinigra TaxID=235986 RepID=UPI002DDB70CB|nr:AsnC family protein [Actinacidiphila glaucinigra]WSD65832.1 AsnC family protein [Actinacidiphila glaucinigra]
MTERPTAAHDAHHLGRIRLEHLDSTHAGHSPVQKGATAHWADGTTSYVLHTRSGDAHGWAVADETDTAIRAMDALRAGEDITPGTLRNALRDVRRLRGRLEALEAELILYAREADADGEPRLPFRAIGEEVGTTHPAVMERHRRLSAGEVPYYRNWLIQGTVRVRLGAVTHAGQPMHGDCTICGEPITEGVAMAARGGYAHEACHPLGNR